MPNSYNYDTVVGPHKMNKPSVLHCLLQTLPGELEENTFPQLLTCKMLVTVQRGRKRAPSSHVTRIR